MGISGIGLYGQGYSYNPLDRLQQNHNNVNEAAMATTSTPSTADDTQLVQKAPKILAQGQLEDFAFDFKKSKEFSMVGEDSSLASLDQTGKVADVQKDELLDQYKFFVNSANDPVQYAGAEGSVRRVIR